MEIVRQLLFSLERSWEEVYGVGNLDIDGNNRVLLRYNFELLKDAGYVVGQRLVDREDEKEWANAEDYEKKRFYRLTWQGHDFLDAVRDPTIWEKTKKGAEDAGGFTVDLLRDLAKGFVKKQIEEYTGVKL